MTPSADAETRVLLENWQAGDRQSLDVLLERNLSWIRGRVQKRLGAFLRRKGDATDYVQETMVEVLSYGPRFVVSNQAAFRALLAKIIENVLRSSYSWHKAQRRSDDRARPLSRDSVLDLDPPRG